MQTIESRYEWIDRQAARVYADLKKIGHVALNLSRIRKFIYESMIKTEAMGHDSWMKTGRICVAYSEYDEGKQWSVMIDSGEWGEYDDYSEGYIYGD